MCARREIHLLLNNRHNSPPSPPRPTPQQRCLSSYPLCAHGVYPRQPFQTKRVYSEQKTDSEQCRRRKLKATRCFSLHINVYRLDGTSTQTGHHRRAHGNAIFIRNVCAITCARNAFFPTSVVVENQRKSPLTALILTRARSTRSHFYHSRFQNTLVFRRRGRKNERGLLSADTFYSGGGVTNDVIDHDGRRYNP